MHNGAFVCAVFRYCLPFVFAGAGTRFHDFHHTKNVGNYGRNELWDVIGGTAGAWYTHIAQFPTIDDLRRHYQQVDSSKDRR